ncbi:DUF937 domain-containing protein [Corynebacterium cystitidis]|uniref:DUF937 domain-containing protein n=1 Tax=Corynebacterium cystitidis TaxID=35757 RepID=UPI00211E004A|nr:DUF937 domain-containing protein [Corynebacterium cystitidis]
MTINIKDLLSKLPYEDLAKKTGENPQKVRTTAEGILNSLLLGMGANAEDPAGRESLANAVKDHDPQLVEGDVNVDDIDTNDGEKIATHIFGQNKDQVTQQLGGALGDSNLVRQLLPLLAPLALSWLSNRMQQGGSPQGGSPQGGMLQQILQQVTGGHHQTATEESAPEQPAAAQKDVSSMLKDVLGGLLGGGRR